MKLVNLVFLIKGDQILLAMKKRGFGVGKYNGTGGKLLLGETMLESAVRETEEEIGVIVNQADLEKVAVLEFSFPDKDNLALECHVFFTKKWKGQPVETEEMKPDWFNKSELPLDKMWVDDPLWLPNCLEGKKLEATFKFAGDGEEILDYKVNIRESLE